MLICMKRENLMLGLSRVVGVVERRQTLPVLGNFLVVAKGEGVEITGTDLEIEIRTRGEAKIERAGEVTVPARKLVEIIRALPEGVEITLKVEKDRAFVVAGKSRFTLSTLPAGDFPTMADATPIEKIKVPQKSLRCLLEKTAFAMAHQDVRYYLNGLLIEVKPDRLVAVATDGHRLAKVVEEIPLDLTEDIEIILPRKAVTEVSRLLAGEADREEEVDVEISGKLFRCRIGETVVTTKLVDGKYPDYERVIPRTTERIAYTDKDALRQALLRTAILSNEKFRGVRINLDEGRLKLQSHNPEQEEAEEELDVEYNQGPAVMGFNIGYIIDVLNVLDEKKVEIGFGGANTSATLRNKDKDGEIFVVMPMRL